MLFRLAYLLMVRLFGDIAAVNQNTGPWPRVSPQPNAEAELISAAPFMCMS